VTSGKYLSPLSEKKIPVQARYSFLIFLFFAMRFFIFAYNRVVVFSPVVSVYYTLSYNLGFIPRAFVGSVIALFTNSLTNNELRLLISAVTLLLLALISVLLGKAIGSSKNEFKPAAILFTILLLTAPLSHTYLVERHFGRLDTFLLLITLISLVFLKMPYIRWAVPAFCFAAVATHPGYILTYMPALAIPMFYEIYRNQYSKRNIVLFSSACIILLSFFVYFQFFPVQVHFADAESFGKYLSARTDMKVSVPVLYLEYISPHLDRLTNPDTFTDLMLPMLRNTALPTILVFIAFTFPLIIIFTAVWKTCIRNASNKFLKLVFVLCALSPLAFIPAALFGQDWERWWAAAINCQFIFIFYFIISGEKPLLYAVKKIYDFFDRHMLILLFVLIYSGTLMLSNICSFILDIFDKHIWLDFFAKVLQNFDYTI
jgi:hypothetical protein